MIRCKFLIIINILTLLCGTGYATGATSDTEQIRDSFKKAYLQAEKGQLGSKSAQVQALRDYVLYPDLLAAIYTARLRQTSTQELSQFIDTWGELRVTRDLRRRWIRRLSANGRWQQVVQLSKPTDSTRYQCLALTAQWKLGESSQSLLSEAQPLWLVGKSQPKECDGIFGFLKSSGVLNQDLIRERLDLAIEAHEFRLAAYLAKSLTPFDQARVKAWRNMQSQPGQEIVARNIPDTTEGRALLRYGIERLARSDPFFAWRLWSKHQQDYGFSDAEVFEVHRHIAVRSALKNHPSAPYLFAELDQQDQAVGEWRLRLALKDRDWNAVLSAVSDLPPELEFEEIFVYWKARALGELGDQATADLLFGSLASNRSYYGFLSADRLNRPYTMNHQSAQVDNSLLIALEQNPRILRARELFAVGFVSKGRSAWNEAMVDLTEQERSQAAILANRWGWHSRAIATASANGLFDDLDIRYPLAFRTLMEKQSERQKIDMTWAWGIARSESLFMPDVVSKAGALGLMQVMPSTGKLVAKRNNIPYRSWRSLLNPNTNVALGTTYLRDMQSRFQNNPVLASAAYNAGPHRVQRWLPKQQMEADVWVDTIPFKETRGYVRRVMASQIIFYWRLNGEQTRLAATMADIQPAAGATQGASSVAAF